MRVYLSRHRITYAPAGGEAVELLTPLDLSDAEPRFEGGAESGGADWAAANAGVA